MRLLLSFAAAFALLTSPAFAQATTGAGNGNAFPSLVPINTITVTTNAVQALCASACTAYDISAINTSGVVCYVQEFNTAAASVTLGTTVPVRIFAVAATSGSYAADSIPPTNGRPFSTAWSFATTTTPTGSTACGSSVYVTADRF